MVAYSFQPRFVASIEAGTKRWTIRAERKRHARPGEALQLYTGMRTRQCRLIGRSVCIGAGQIRLELAAGRVAIGGQPYASTAQSLDAFARDDGFADWTDLRAFWAEQHAGVDPFSGVIVSWRDLVLPG